MSLNTTLWIALGVLVAGMLALDLFVFHRDAHEVRLREAAAWSVVWIPPGLAFGGVVFLTRESQAAASTWPLCDADPALARGDRRDPDRRRRGVGQRQSPASVSADRQRPRDDGRAVAEPATERSAA